ncbi:beta-microseminoprotein-like [Ascaphus truei]|uniref:beta-microseminoprotein-like n=1 Tax=Ascaphus truei TaxID=8439 RepID=UPI003F593FFC
MTYGLGCVLALCMITLCNTQCNVENVQHIGHNSHNHNLYQEDMKGCMKNGVMHEVGASWNDNCLRCTCHGDVIECCATDLIPVSTDARCETIRDVNCKNRLVRKDDNSQSCEADSWMA